jgi:hypothetical protein
MSISTKGSSPDESYKLQPIPTLQDAGTDLIGLDFEDDVILWTVTKSQAIRRHSRPILPQEQS